MGGLEKKKVSRGDAGAGWRGGRWGTGTRRSLGTAPVSGLGPSWAQKRLGPTRRETAVRRGPKMREEGTTRPVKSGREPWSRAVRELVTQHSFTPKAGLAEGQLLSKTYVLFSGTSPCP